MATRKGRASTDARSNKTDPIPGSFAYIDQQIQSLEPAKAKGDAFEDLCRFWLQRAPQHRGRFKHVWLWDEWPGRWGSDKGIDLVAETTDGLLWAIQSKAIHPDRSIPKRELDSFLSESNRADFAYRLIIATTDDIGRNAQHTLDGQEKPIGVTLRGDLLSAELQWPTKFGQSPKPLAAKRPRRHQRRAIRDVLKGFQEQDRGQLIMAGGTGKTLTALWIAERLKSRRTLLLVPSLSLMSQTISEWGRNCAEPFDFLAVCSDETVAQRGEDHAITSTRELGVPVTTDVAEICSFLRRRHNRAAVVFCTYQSSERIAEAQAQRTPQFDLVLSDEAHRLAGNADGLFATVLDGKKIKACKRLFMTATPRYIKDHVKQKAAELEFEIVSMDDAHVFGSEFHVLTFHEAISADPPLLTDYQVVVIGVTNREAKAWVENAHLVRTADGLSTDARTLAAQIGLAKAMKKYDLRKVITFHSSVAKAKRFVDDTQRDSLPGVIRHLSHSARPSGKLSAKHISGITPAGRRATLLKGLGDLPNGTRGIISNCACLGEGVDVPVLDGVAFIDPKRSMVDIIQAVGRVIRKAEGKQIGTIVIPVFIDESEDADHVLSQSAFKPVWQVLRAIRAHDRRLADELDQLRLSLGRRSKSSGRISLPNNIHLDVPRLLLRDFEQAFYVRTIEQTTDRPPLTIDQILVWVDEYRATTGEWPKYNSGRVSGTDELWSGIDFALVQGRRQLPGGSSLAKLLAEHRDVRNKQDLPPLTIAQILDWADVHKKRSGEWPKRQSGKITGTEETWSAVENALKGGFRGFPGGTSVAKLLSEYRGVRNVHDLPPLTIDQILVWVDEHKAVTGEWPKQMSGKVRGTDETWLGIATALDQGGRGLAGGSSLANLLREHRGVRSHMNLPRLTIDQILVWTDEHKAATGKWPNKTSGKVAGTDESWGAIDVALKKGGRGLPGGSSLAKLRAEQRGVRNTTDLPPLTIEQILVWAEEHRAATGEWPKRTSGKVAGTDEMWKGIDAGLYQGQRGLRGGSSLAKLLAEQRGVRNLADLPPLTIDQILTWADEHQAATGEWPKSTSGRVRGTEETWGSINNALQRGSRDLPSDTSLAKLLADQRGVRNIHDLPSLTIQQILTWADEHKTRTGNWPKQGSGEVPGTDETWRNIDRNLRDGRRGLPGGSSLPNLLVAHRGGRNQKAPLTIEQILIWADEHKAATGEWPKRTSGKVTDTNEKWKNIDRALRQCRRGLSGESSLAELLAEQRSAC